MIATAMSRDPAITAIQELVHAGQPGKRDERPGPPDLAGEKNHGINAADVAIVGGQNMHFLEGSAGVEVKPLHYPVRLQREKEKAAATKDEIELSGCGGAGWALGIV